MRNLLTVAALLAAVAIAGDVLAQCGSGSGSSCGTNQCNLNNRPREAAPTSVPQVAPVSLQRVAATDQWKAPEKAEKVVSQTAEPMRTNTFTTVATHRTYERDNLIKPASLNLGLVNVGNGRRNPDALIAQTRADIAQQEARMNRLEQELIDARARGEEVSYEDVQRIVTAARYQPTPDEAYQLMKASPQFQRDLQELLNNQRPEIVRWEVVSVE